MIVAAAGNNRAGLNPGSDVPVQPAVRSRPARGSAQLGRCHVGVDPVVVAAVRAVGRLADPGGAPSAFTTAGPWVGVAAPGENIVVGEQRRRRRPRQRAAQRSGAAVRHQRQPAYAAAYVSGVAALVRSRFPELHGRRRWSDRLTASAQGAARSPSNLVGAGLVDPVAALTWDVRPGLPVTPRRPKPTSRRAGGARRTGLHAAHDRVHRHRRPRTWPPPPRRLRHATTQGHHG